jgi:hypothetical protein
MRTVMGMMDVYVCTQTQNQNMIGVMSGDGQITSIQIRWTVIVNIMKKKYK